MHYSRAGLAATRAVDGDRAGGGGGIDLLVESDVFDYDILPQMAIVQAAGGIVTDWQGQPLGNAQSYATVLMAANAELHRAALDILCRA